MTSEGRRLSFTVVSPQNAYDNFSDIYRGARMRANLFRKLCRDWIVPFQSLRAGRFTFIWGEVGSRWSLPAVTSMLSSEWGLP